jgi:hypothetical protein
LEMKKVVKNSWKAWNTEKHQRKVRNSLKVQPQNAGGGEAEATTPGKPSVPGKRLAGLDEVYAHTSCKPKPSMWQGLVLCGKLVLEKKDILSLPYLRVL